MPDRITLSRAKGWRKPEGAIVVARPTIWGNPWGVGVPGTLDLMGTVWQSPQPIDAATAVALYTRMVYGLIADPDFLPPVELFTIEGRAALHDAHYAKARLIRARLHELRGHDLCCWCKPGQPCHADVLLRLANGGEG